MITTMDGHQSQARASTGSRRLESIKKVAVTMAAQQALFMELDQEVYMRFTDLRKVMFTDAEGGGEHHFSKVIIMSRTRAGTLNIGILSTTSTSESPLSQSYSEGVTGRTRHASEPTADRPVTIITEYKPQPEYVRKVAITADEKDTIFYECNQNRPLAAIIQDICDKWGLSNKEDYALRFSELNRQGYITEENRCDIENGNVLQFTDSPAKAAEAIISKLDEGNRDEKISSLQRLTVLATDVTFATEFINKAGLKLIIDYVVAGNRMFSGDPLMYLLKTFIALMDHGLVSWDILDPAFTNQVGACVSEQRQVGAGCIHPALEILECVILHSSDCIKHDSLDTHITPENVIRYIASTNSDVKRSAIAVLNALFIKATPQKKKKIADSFQSKHFREAISSGVLRSTQNIGPEMAHQLAKLQRHMLNLYEDRMNETVNSQDSAQTQLINKSIEDLRRIAFDFTDVVDPNIPTSRKSPVSTDYKKLGFAHPSSPGLDFEEVPPGLLALDNMLYIARIHKESYIKVVLENSGRADEHGCPFVQASIKLTKILCDLFRIGDSPYEDENVYYPMFFAVDKPLEEFFSICIQTLNRTWKDMRASKEDFQKVLNVVHEQITRSLDKSQMPKSFDIFQSKINLLAYAEIKKIWDAERQRKDESEAQARPIVELREKIKPEIIKLVRNHRLNYLEAGTRFPKYEAKGRVKNRYQYWRLAPNHKAFHFGDCTESGDPTLEQLKNTVVVLEIKQLLTGKDCLHVKNTKRSQLTELAFALVVEIQNKEEQETVFPFMASSDTEYDIWVDGINTLLNNKMTSRQMSVDMETLLSMEIKLRLLETEGITIPTEPPPIPPLPDNFNFAYTTS